jgi:hypothetical protein
MLRDILTRNQAEVIRRCKEAAAKRYKPAELPAAIDHGVPLFLQQLVDTLRLEEASPERSAGESEEAPTAIGRAAALHGAELLRLGYSIDQVVHEYGDICQSVTAIAMEGNQAISADEFRTLNRCLDDAIADAVKSFGAARQMSINRESRTLSDCLTVFLDEYDRLLDVATQAYSAMRTGNVGVVGATGALLAYTLTELRSLPGRSLTEIPQSGAAT